MRAAVLKDWKQIEIRDIAAPQPGPGEVLIDVAYTGICGSDVHIYNGHNPIARTPVVLGHEFTGRVAVLGYGVKGLSTNIRAVVQPLESCGDCTPCRRGSPHVCESLIVIGVNQDGAFAEQAVVPADCVFPIPDDLADETAALAEPFSIATHSLTRGRISAADRVLVIGAGPIGLYCALTARYMGAQTVHVSEPNPQRREMATKFGVASTDPTQEDAKESLAAASQGEGFDLVVETSGVRAGFDFAIEAAAVQGHLVLLGFPSGGTADIPITRCILKELELIGSRVCTRAEFQKTLDMLTAMQSGGEIDFGSLIAGARPLEDLDRAIHDVANSAENAKTLIKPV